MSGNKSRSSQYNNSRNNQQVKIVRDVSKVKNPREQLILDQQIIPSRDHLQILKKSKFNVENNNEYKVIAVDNIKYIYGNIVGIPDLFVSDSNNNYILIDHKNRAFLNHGIKDRDVIQLTIYKIMLGKVYGLDPKADNFSCAINHMEYTVSVVPEDELYTHVGKALDKFAYDNKEFKNALNFIKAMTKVNPFTVSFVSEFVENKDYRDMINEFISITKFDTRLNRYNIDVKNISTKSNQLLALIKDKKNNKTAAQKAGIEAHNNKASVY